MKMAKSYRNGDRNYKRKRQYIKHMQMKIKINVVEESTWRSLN